MILSVYDKSLEDPSYTPAQCPDSSKRQGAMTEYRVGGRGFQVLEDYFEGLVQRLQRAFCHPEAMHEHCDAPCNAFEVYMLTRQWIVGRIWSTKSLLSSYKLRLDDRKARSPPIDHARQTHHLTQGQC